MVLNILITVISLILGIFIGYFSARKNSDAKIKELEVQNAKLQFSSDLTKNLQEEFKNIANQALIDNQNQLQKQNSLVLEDKLKPLNNTLERYQKEVDEFNKERIKEAATLKTEITNLMENSKIVQEEAHRLANALTKNQNVKGQFGEDTLEVVLNASGMKENIHYKKQFHTRVQNADGENKTIRYDFVVNLPEDKHIVIDSKMYLDNFIKYQATEEKTEKEKYLKDFKVDVKNSIKDLSEKNYQYGEKINSPDFVFMYIPLENSLSLLYDDTELVQFAFQKKIFLIGTVSLMTTLKLVQKLLEQEKRSANIVEIAQTGALLYEKFVDFCENLKNLHRKFEGVDEEFKTTINRFTRGEDSLFKKSEKLKELGISTTKQIPQEFLTQEEEYEVV